MRNNQPVTNNEYLVPDGEMLVSVTDVKGRITYCNPVFVAVSGYAAHELMGQPHNIVRHPDMPEEAFRDLWATVQAGRPWTGLVKNRRKNGDFYWVQANAAPLMDGDRITGYLSVRGVPDRASVQAAEALYATLRAEAARGSLVHVLRHGRVVRRGEGPAGNPDRRGCPADRQPVQDPAQFGVAGGIAPEDQVVGGAPYGATTIAGGDGSRKPSEIELAGARHQGELVAKTAAKIFG